MAKSMKRTFLLAVLLIMLVLSFLQGGAGMNASALAGINDRDSTQNDTSQIEEMIDGIIGWKREALSFSAEQPILGDPFLKLAGSTAGDWFPIGMGRYGHSDDYDAYLAVVTDYVNTKYTGKNKLDSAKATEWHRISLAITASGGNPLRFGDYQGNPIDLIADGTYNRGLTVSPGRQGINGWIWALIALDSKRYEVPRDAYHTRQDFIVEILKCQLSDGGFALTGKVSDPDITAMAVQSLAPYYNSEMIYSYKSSKLKDENNSYIEVKKTVKQVVDEAINLLGCVQLSDGDFSSWGMSNAESTCQVIVALTSLNINPLKDSRFIKNKTLLDGIKKYRLDNGGFLHSFVYDPDNPTSKPNEANDMAGDQALYALVSLWRNANGMRALYDMREEFTIEEKTQIAETIDAVNTLNDISKKNEVENVFQKYVSIDELSRNYITNYWKLSDLLKKVDLEVPEENPDYSGGDSSDDDVITFFSGSDAQAVKALPSIKNLNTGYYTEVVRLKYKLENAENADVFTSCKIILEKAYNQIVIIQREIDGINAEILDKLHPFDRIDLGNKKTIYSIVERYNALSEYDRTKITHYEDLLKSKTQVDNLTTALIISIICGAAAVCLTTFIVLNIRKRKKKKQALQMTESEE